MTQSDGSVRAGQLVDLADCLGDRVRRDPRKVRNVGLGGGDADLYREGIRAGGELRFPLSAAAEAQSRVIVEEVRVAEAAEAAHNARHSFSTGMGAPPRVVIR